MAKQTVLLTGATGAIGRAIAKNFADKGDSLILVARSLDKLQALQEELLQNSNAKQVSIETCDVANVDEVETLLQSLKQRGIDVNILVNCAGISGGGLAAEIDNDLWVNVINTNLNGPFFVTKTLLNKKMMPSGGRIINIASTGGKQGVIYGAPYCASKHGLVGFTKALGLELAKNRSGITANAICPGFVESEMAERVREHYSRIWDTSIDEAKRRVEDRVPIGRYIEPQEVADMVSYVASPQAAGVTAQAINVCGGLGNY